MPSTYRSRDTLRAHRAVVIVIGGSLLIKWFSNLRSLRRKVYTNHFLFRYWAEPSRIRYADVSKPLGLDVPMSLELIPPVVNGHVPVLNSARQASKSPLPWCSWCGRAAWLAGLSHVSSRQLGKVSVDGKNEKCDSAADETRFPYHHYSRSTWIVVHTNYKYWALWLKVVVWFVWEKAHTQWERIRIFRILHKLGFDLHFNPTKTTWF